MAFISKKTVTVCALAVAGVVSTEALKLTVNTGYKPLLQKKRARVLSVSGKGDENSSTHANTSNKVPMLKKSETKK